MGRNNDNFNDKESQDIIERLTEFTDSPKDSFNWTQKIEYLKDTSKESESILYIAKLIELVKLGDKVNLVRRLMYLKSLIHEDIMKAKGII